jgi:hypothetical protein
VIDVEEWAEIRRLHRAEGMGIKAIARRLGVARNTVRTALRAEEAPIYVREGRGSAVDAFEPAIRRLLALTPDMPATVVAERIGWTRGITVLRERVAELRPACEVPEAFGRTEYKAGELSQWDLWFPDYAIPVGYGQTAVLPVLVGVPCYSRFILGRMIGSKASADVLGGHLGLLVELGKVPKMGVYDGEPAISVRRGKPHLHRGLPAAERHARHGLDRPRQGTPGTKGCRRARKRLPRDELHAGAGLRRP